MFNILNVKVILEKILNDPIGNVLKFIDYKGISVRKFAQSVGISHSLFSNNSAIGSDKLLKILTIYPEINPEWLLTGEGEMLRSEVGRKSEKSESVEYLKELLKAKEKIIALQEEKIEALEKIKAARNDSLTINSSCIEKRAIG